jgi:hypothetical protein
VPRAPTVGSPVPNRPSVLTAEVYRLIRGDGMAVGPAWRRHVCL